MERSISSEEKRRLRAYLRQGTLFSRLALYILGPIWLVVVARCAVEIISAGNFEAWVSANDSFWAINRIEISMGLTILLSMAIWHNRSERFEIGRVRETSGVLSGETGKGYILDGKPLRIPYTMDIGCSAYVGKNVIVESADVLRTKRGEGNVTERYVVALKHNDFTSVR